jgi:hypothetical protein
MYKMFVGDVSGSKLLWDGTQLKVYGSIYAN